MNKVFRVIWSQATQSWVAVSELTKAHKKQSSSNKQKSADGFSGKVIKYSAIALALLSSHSAYAAINVSGTGSDTSVAFGGSSSASGANAVAIGTGAQATQGNTVAVGKGSTASGGEAVAIGQNAQAIKNQAIALGQGAQATGDRAISIGQNSKANQADTIALGTGSKSTNTNTVALGRNTEAAGQRSMAFGNEAKATANDSLAFGAASNAKKEADIIIGKDAKSRDEGGGRSIAIGQGATAGSDKAVYDANGGGNSGGVAIGVGSFTGLNKTNKAINSSVALGAGAGAGYRMVGTDGSPTGNATDADDNDTVLVKAFGGTKTTLDYFKDSGKAKADGFFSFQGVDINEGTALGRNTRAIGDQSVAIGAQSVAGMGSIVIGGNDIQAYDGKKYFKAANPNSGDAKGVNDFNAETTPGTGKNGQPITITAKYKELVGAELDRAYRASYGQDGSTVIGMQAHSTTPLGVAIGTNAIVRKGAFGATAIGSGASILANAEAAVAIGMGAEAQGNYAVAAGTAARAKESAVAVGYQANAVESSVAVGHEAKSTKESDIAVGKGAIASGNQGAIAMGLGTQAQGDSSIMIGGSEINKVAAQTVKYQKEKKDAQGRAVIKSTKKTETIGGEQIERTIRSVEMEDASGSIQNAYMELTNGRTLDTARLDYSLAANKNGHGSISMGIHSLSTGDLGTAIGTGARVTKLGGVALGTGAISELQNGVAIGTGSRADENSKGTRQTDISYDEEGHIVPFDSKKVAYTFYWAGGTNTSEGDVVSFGTPGAERQLKNVAAGRIADDSTDAINGSQLNSVTKRMSSGWAVEAEKDKDSSGVLKYKGADANAGSEVHSADGKATTRENPGTATGHVDKVRLNDEVKIRVGDNLVLNQEDATRDAYEDPDNPNRKTGTHVTSKFTYSLNPVLSNLTSAEFKGTDAAPTTKLTNAGVTITPATATGKKSVSLTQNGLDNGGNPITNVAGNLDGAKAGTDAPKTNAAAPNTTDKNGDKYISPNNAATVGDVLNAGWNLQEKGKAKDFVTAYDTVNFVDGDGTSVSVTTNTDGKSSEIKYSVNTGNGLQKDPTGNTISVKPADKSLEVTDAGVKVKAADNTLTTDDKGLKVNTGTINPVDSGDKAGTVEVNTNDAGKIATVDTVVNAVNKAAWNAIASKTNDGENGGTVKKQAVKAGDTVTFEADKNIKIAQDNGKFTFSTKDNVEFTTVKVGDTVNGKKPVELKNGDVINANNNPTQPTTALNVSSDSKPTQITGVGSVLNTEAVPTIPAGTATDAAQQPKLVNLGTAHGQPALGDNVLNAAATVRDLASMGWVVSSDKTTDATTGEYKDVVKNANEVKFVGKNAAKVSGKTDPATGIRTITVDVTVPETKTAELVSSKDGSVIAPSTDSKLQEALKAAKDELAKLPKDASDEQKKEAENKVKAAETELNKALDNKGVATAKNVADMINASGFTLKTSATADGKKESGDDEVINPGKAVEMVAGKNLTVKQEANGKVTYSTKDDVSFNTVQVGGSDGPKLTKTKSGDLKLSDKDDTKPVAITNVKSNLPETKNGIPAEVTKAQPAPILGTEANQVNASNAATVGDVLNAGWNLQNNGDARDFVKPYDTVNFVDGLNTKAVVTTDAEGKVSNVQIDVKDLPIAYTNEAGDKVVKAADGKYYKESDLAGKVYDPKTKQFKNADGTALNEQPTAVAGDTVKTNLVNPNAEANKAGNATQLGNVASGANTFAPVEDKKLGNDGKWYPADQVEPNGQPKKDASPVAVPNNIGKAGLIDFSKSNPNNAATVGDLQNLGWIVSAKGNDYSDQVRNANEVKFVGEGTASVTGKTDDKGVRTITVKVDDQVSTNNSVTPVVYTDKDGKTVYPIKDDKGNVTYHTTPDGKGKGDTEIPKGDVITSINGPEGTTAPTTLSNVAGNLDGAKKDTKAPTTEHGPVNSTDAAAPNYVNPNNAATVGTY